MPTEQPAPDNAKNLDEGKNKAPDMFSENVAATRKLIGTYDPEQWFKKKQENKDARPAWDQTAIMKRQGELIEATEATTLRTVKQTKDGKEVETKELGKTTLGIIDIYDGISGNAERIDAMRISKSIENKEADETILKHELSATQERVALYESMALQLHSYMKLVETYDLLKKGALENGLTIDKKKDSAVTLHLAHTQMLAGKRIALACETLPITKQCYA